QGYPDQAKERIRTALMLSEELSHPFTRVFASYHAARLHLLLREERQAQEYAEKAMTLATTQGFAQFAASGTVIRGWILAAQGHEAEGIAQLRQGLETHGAMGVEMLQPYYLALLMEAYQRQGHVEHGLTVLAEALALVDKNDERWWEAELHRLKGELLL